MNEMVLHSGATTEDIFFGLKPHVANWDDVYAHVNELRVDKLLEEAHALEPLQETDINDHKMWVIQQKIRIVLRIQAKKSYVLDATCAECGQHKVDPVHHTCLWCAERSEQMRHNGGRGSCNYINPVYDVKRHSWGLLFYWSRDGNTYMFWMATGFKTCQDAELSLHPLTLYRNWLTRKYHSLYKEWSLEQRMFSLDEMMKRNDLPWQPDELESQLRSRILSDMKNEHSLLSYYISEAMRDYDRSLRDS